jgi:tRNA(fMet)-specific endonuclease VapC
MDIIYGEIRTDLERAGTPIGANDLLIAAHALALDCTLVTDNQNEFKRVAKLRLENWLKQAESRETVLAYDGTC